MIQEEKVTDSTEEKTIEKAERKYEYWLACVASVSRKKKRRLRTTYGKEKSGLWESGKEVVLPDWRRFQIRRMHYS